ncbi:MAG: hypothetical protein A2Z72_05105, partial [Omnitrophica bacterium RBG_13_46_9]
MNNIAAVILAAGRGTRMKSELPKVLQKLHSRPLISFLIDILKDAGIKRIIVVVGYKGELVRRLFPEVETVTQKKLLGSGDAVRVTKRYLSGFKGDIVVMYGDTPLIRRETVEALIKKHKKEKTPCTLLTADVSDPSEYGRIVRDEDGNIAKIVEYKHASDDERGIREVNVGCYCFKKEDLFSCLGSIRINAEKGEYYLTDVVEMLAKRGSKVSSVTCGSAVEALGINSRLDLATAEDILRKRSLEMLMLKGVTIIDPGSTFVDMHAKIGKDVIIRPHTVIEEDVVIGKNCEIGPFARIRPGTVIGDHVEIGNFVELVRAKVSSGTKIKHMTYLGDAVVGRNVNIGAGTITANYDGKKKNKTIIEDGAFIGVGAILIAPVKIGRNATVGAGSVVTKNKDVPPGDTVVG